ncbi:MAG TPA: BrnA antitoxin family protein [Caulobacteraceae bacterium]|nr:BrnA antitoxin family protein [Caulobacteraceae bacterium]
MDPDWVDADEAPDLSAPEWRKVLDATPVTRGRPKSAQPKISTTIRLDADIVAHFRTGGRGWQSRINEALRAGMTRR